MLLTATSALPVGAKGLALASPIKREAGEISLQRVAMPREENLQITSTGVFHRREDQH
jgi:hypothetical protein